MPYHTKSNFQIKPSFEIVVTRMIFVLGLASTTVGVPLYLLKLGASDSQVGLFSGGLSLLIASLTLFLPPLLEEYNQLKILLGSCVAVGLSIVAFGWSKFLLFALVLYFVIQLFNTINTSAMGILFKDSSKNKKEFTKNTGLMGSLVNLSWFIGPLLGGLMLNYAGVKGLFIMSGSLCLISACFVGLLPFKTANKYRDKIDGNLKENIKFYLSHPRLRVSYLINMGISVWWGFIWTFIPIFMIKQGYSVASIGIFVGVTQLPLFLFEFVTVKALNKYSYKKIFLCSYILLVLVGVVAFLTTNYTVVLITILTGSLALCFIEPISQLFFFDQVTKVEEEKTYPIFETASIIGGTLVKLIIGAGLAIFVDRAAFLIISLFMLVIVYNVLKINSTHKYNHSITKTPV